MYCRNCGSELAEDARFCKKCGVAVRDRQQEAAEKPASTERPVSKAKPLSAVKTFSAAKSASAAKSVSAGKADKVDVKLIAAVAVFLVLQLGVATKIVSSVNTTPGAQLDPILAVDGTEGVNLAESYFSKEIRVGGTVEFGRYEQDGNTQNGPEPIVWDVTASFEDGYLLVSRYILDGMPWDDGSGGDSVLELKTEITYEQCSMRRWIRDSFSAETFTEEERSLIIPVSVDGDDILPEKNSRYATDCAFILREDEAEDYWGRASTTQANASLRCAPTEYAAGSGLALDTTAGKARYKYGDSSCTAPWALRRRYTDPKAKQAKIVTVDTSGRFSNAVVTETLGFRPAIYVVYG